MSVANNQIPELLDIIEKHVPRENIKVLLAGLRLSSAAKHNKSFAETVWRLLNETLKREADNRD
jgi:hypothetical protein